MTDFTDIINECLAVAGEDFPADPNDETAWHFTDKDIRGLLARVAERVEEEMLDPVKVGEVVAKLSIERDEARQAAYELSLDTHDDFKLSLFMHKYPWLEERHR
jgi:hypothetical protein